jgi:hypothetical protein
MLGTGVPALPQETNCPAYPSAARAEAQQAIELDQLFAALRKTASQRRQASGAAMAAPPSRNFIDDRIFGKMTADGVEPAPLTTDAEFLRRIYLDLTGRTPTFEQAQAFLNDASADKRDRLIDSLLSSPAFVDQFSHWFLQRFQVVRGASDIGIPTRNNFYAFVRQFVAEDRPYDAFVRDMLIAAGDADVSPAIGFLNRQMGDFFENATQDFWDNFTDASTTQFLGFKTDCISCHNGRGHLEKINLFLTPRPRRQFWQLSAFFSRTRFQVVTDDSAGFRRRIIFSDTGSGPYTGIVSPSSPGPRPSRAGADEQPEYWFTGEQPRSGAWREEWARILTADPQFARAGVNYIWAYFFGSGIVDPPDGWDLARVDPANPPPPDWPLQVSHPELLKELAARFAGSQYSLRSIIKLIVSSNAYQLSSRYPAGKWQAAFARYFARHEARRLTAEQIFDSLTTATGTEPFLEVDGMPGTFRYANQLPHPRSTVDFGVDSLLTSLGQGDWVTTPPSRQPSLFGVLDFFNNGQVAGRTRSWSDGWSPQSRLAVWVGSGLGDAEIIRNLFLATLSRTPTDAELAAILSRRQPDRLMWLTSVQWALLQKADFVFNL